MPNNTCFLDIETTGLNPFKDTIRCIAWQINEEPTTCVRVEDINLFTKEFNQITENGGFVCGHNIGFDIKFLFHNHIIPTVNYNFIDTNLLYHSLNPHESCKLKDLAEKHLGVIPIRLKDLQLTGRGKGKKKIALSEIPLDELMEYCKQDVVLSYELYKRTELFNVVNNFKGETND